MDGSRKTTNEGWIRLGLGRALVVVLVLVALLVEREGTRQWRHHRGVARMPLSFPFVAEAWMPSPRSNSCVGRGNACSGKPIVLSSSTTTTEQVPSSNQPPKPKRRQLGLLSFDLDDTLFPTTQVVEDANQAMMAHMQRVAQCPTSLDHFLSTTLRIRQGLNGTPITYSDLRKRAIAAELQEWGWTAQTNDNMDQEAMVEQCFQVWLQERHRAAERYLFDDVLDMLETIQHTHSSVCLAAITNGRGNPLDMPSTLAPFFDFCVSGEDEAVFPHRKPHAGIYQHAYQWYQTVRPDHHPQPAKDNDNETEYIWCHVGDCLANDVGASANQGALAIWLAPDFASNQDDEATRPTESSSSPSQPKWSTATASEVSHRQVLAQEAQSKMAAQITSLTQLPQVIEQLLINGDSTTKMSSQPDSKAVPVEQPVR